MKRLIDKQLLAWKNNIYRKSLLIHGARQIGKTYAVRQLGATYQNFVEIDFEDKPYLIPIFEYDFDTSRIVKELSEKLNITIDPKTTLLFFDEIQVAPRVITALRYFYEKMPELHVIAAGSLVAFAIQKVGMPVGRVQELNMYPLSFLEFLWATGHDALAQEIIDNPPEKSANQDSHQTALKLLGEYIAVGGMPDAVTKWCETKDINECFDVFKTIIVNYRQDFNKYADKLQLKYVALLFDHVPHFLGQQFKFSSIPGDYKKNELSPCLDLLETAGIVTPVLSSAGNGIPMGAEANLNDFKIIFLDVALSQAILGLQSGDWPIDPLKEFVNKGGLVEAFVGQELLVYSTHLINNKLYYWHKETRDIHAEVDYLIQNGPFVIPVEVKSSSGTTLKSLYTFLETHPKSPYGIRFSTQNYSVHAKIHSYPLYAIWAVIQNLRRTR